MTIGPALNRQYESAPLCSPAHFTILPIAMPIQKAYITASAAIPIHDAITSRRSGKMRLYKRRIEILAKQSVQGKLMPPAESTWSC